MYKKIFKKNILYRIRRISGRNILFGKDLCMELNELAYLILDNIDGVKSIKDIIDIISKDYSIERNQIELDTTVFINEMKMINVIKEAI